MRMNLQAIERLLVSEAVRDHVRLRIPRTLAFYQRRLRPRLTGQRGHIGLSDWVNQGVKLVADSGAVGVRFDREGAWFEDPSGFLWCYQGDLFGTGTWAEHGDEYEREETALMAGLLPAGGTMIDIGANVGLHCIKLAQRIEGIKILACEPVAGTLACLQRNVRKNGVAEQIEICRVALGDHTGEIRITATREIANFVVSDRMPAAPAATETVPSQRLDDLVGERLERVDLIKCDVEGSELAVLRGASGTLARFKPTVFVEIVERYTRRYGHGPAAVFELMRARGYRPRVGHRRSPPARDRDAGRRPRATPNFLFVSQ